MAIEIKVPDIGDFDKVPVIEVLVSAGDQVEAEQSLITLESEKATMEVPSSASGTITEVKASEGDEVGEGDVIALLEESADGSSDGDGDDAESKEQAGQTSETGAEEETEPTDEAKGEEATADEEGAGQQTEESRDPAAAPTDDVPARSKQETPRPPPVVFDAADVAGDIPYASPAVRQFARELGVDLSKVRGSGEGGRILRDDVQGFVKQTMRSDRPASGSGMPGIAPPPKVDFAKYGEVEEVELSRIRKLSGANLHRNWVTIPHVTQHDEADITDLEAFRKAHGDEAEAKGFKLTPLAFQIKACVAALKEFPDFNASLSADGQTLVRKKYYHIGVAVDTPNGLVVPVIRNCDKKGLFELAEELVGLSEKARDGKLTPAQMSGGCFSISSLGGISGTAFTPIVALPEVAILGVSRATMQPVWNKGSESFEPRLIMPLSLSYDHRVIDGASAARFTKYLGMVLGDLRKLLL